MSENTIESSNENTTNFLLSETQQNPPNENNDNKINKIALLTIIFLVAISIITLLSLLYAFHAFSSNRHHNQPLIIEPTSTHTHTIVYIHGLGSEPNKYRYFFYNKTHIPEYNNTRIILLNADVNYVSFTKNKTTSWFDIYAFPVKNDGDFNIDDIKESSDYVKEIIKQEALKLNNSYGKIILGGHSQGAVVSMYTAYTLEENLGMILVNSGFLCPLKMGKNKDKLRVFAGHGGLDEAILSNFTNYTYGKVMNYSGFEYHFYPNMSHKISGEEIKDMEEFIEKYW